MFVERKIGRALGLAVLAGVLSFGLLGNMGCSRYNQCYRVWDCGECEVCQAGECVPAAVCPDLCEGVVCDNPDQSICLDANTLRSFDAKGSCSQGKCSYPTQDRICSLGCDSTSLSCKGCDNPCPKKDLTECKAGQVRSCDEDTLLCLNWGAWQDCPGKTCANGEACVVCDQKCEQKDSLECQKGQVRTCLADANGCRDWTPWNDCPTKTCSSATGCLVCEHTCEAKGLTQCDGGKLKSCLADAVTGCRSWGAPVACPTNACKDTQSCAGCTDANECPSSGLTSCQDGAMRTCEAGLNGCLYWSRPDNCPTGYCLDDKKCYECTNVCTLDDGQCSQGNKKSCVVFQGCTIWTDPLACANGFCATNGRDCGVCPTTGACTDKSATECTNGLTRSCINDSNGCLIWGSWSNCEKKICANGTNCGTCPEGFDNCDNDPSNGCETNLTNTAKHCGRCDIDCGSGSCVGSQCQACTPNCTGKCGGASDGCRGTCTSCETGTVCQKQSCMACGASGQPCCAKDTCNSGNMCNSGTCVSSTCAGKSDFTRCKVVTTPDRKYDICIGGTCVSPGCGDASCNTPGPNFPLADTNQRNCYNWTEMTCPSFGQVFYGQDAQYGWDATHPASERFTRDLSFSGQPVVKDNVTGLMWQGCAYGQTGNVCQVGSETTTEWATQLANCNGLNWGGYTDWRLPDMYELDSIVDAGKSNPSIDTTAFPATPSEIFWSSSSYANNVSLAGYVWFNFGHVNVSGKSHMYHARCVRGGPVEARRFEPLTLSGNRVVKDNITGLMWQGCAAGQTGNTCGTGSAATMYWLQALSTCEGLSWAGHTDWRLPNRKELFSIVDAGKHNPSIDTTAFPATPISYFWSSSSYAYNVSSAWYVHFYDGYVSSYGKSEMYHARCVRDGP